MTVILDIIMIGLLIAVISRIVEVNRKIKKLKDLEGEISPVLKSLTVTLASSASQLEILKKTSQQLEIAHNQRLNTTKELLSDLDFIVSHGNKTADNLEGLLQEARSLKNLVPATDDKAESSGQPACEPASLPLSDIYEKNKTKVSEILTSTVNLKEAKEDHTKAITKDNIRLMLMEKFKNRGLFKNA